MKRLLLAPLMLLLVVTPVVAQGQAVDSTTTDTTASKPETPEQVLASVVKWSELVCPKYVTWMWEKREKRAKRLIAELPNSDRPTVVKAVCRQVVPGMKVEEAKGATSPMTMKLSNSGIGVNGKIDFYYWDSPVAGKVTIIVVNDTVYQVNYHQPTR